MAKQKTDFFRSFMLVAIAIVTIITFGIGLAISHDTFVNPWYPATGAILLGILTALPLYRYWPRLTGTRKGWINFGCQTVVAAAIFFGAFYMLNAFFPDRSTLHEEKATVTRLYSKTHYRTKRISRRVYGRGAPYKVYHADVVLESGRAHTIKVPVERYHRMHKGDKVKIELESGLFGISFVARKSRK